MRVIVPAWALEYLAPPRREQPPAPRPLWTCSHHKIRCGTCREFRAKAHAWLFRGKRR